MIEFNECVVQFFGSTLFFFLSPFLIYEKDDESDGEAMSLIAESVVIRGVKQWSLVRHAHFQTDDEIEGWTMGIFCFGLVCFV